MKCSVADCTSPVVARGWCAKHLARWYRRGGDPAVKGRRTAGDPAARFWPRVNRTAGCWEWQGSLFRSGHGQFHLAGRPVVPPPGPRLRGRPRPHRRHCWEERIVTDTPTPLSAEELDAGFGHPCGHVCGIPKDAHRTEEHPWVPSLLAVARTPATPDATQHGESRRGNPVPIDLDAIEMRWASQWNESDDGEVRAWRDDVAALIDEVRRLRHVSNGYYEAMVARTPDSVRATASTDAGYAASDE